MIRDKRYAAPGAPHASSGCPDRTAASISSVSDQSAGPPSW